MGERARRLIVSLIILAFATAGYGPFLQQSMPDTVAAEEGSGADIRVVSRDAEEEQHIPRWPEWRDRHELYEETGNLWIKVEPDNRPKYNESTSGLGGDGVWVRAWVLGENTTHQTPSSEEFPNGITIHGRKPTTEEVAAVRNYGDISDIDTTRPMVRIHVTSASDLENLTAHRSVWMVEPYDNTAIKLQTHDCSGEHADYTADWIRCVQKVTHAKDSRDDYDGSGGGEMPSGVDFHIIDNGYDPDETAFVEAYANDAIVTTHDWTDDDDDVSDGDNFHGTLVADILDLMNYGGGELHIHKVGDRNDVENALKHIIDSHPGADIVTMSIGTGKIHGATCVDQYDDLLYQLVSQSHRKVMISAAQVNPDGDTTTEGHRHAYPASSTFTFMVRGTEKANPWTTPQDEDLRYGNILLTETECKEQYDYHANREGDFEIYKPDIYGTFVIDYDRHNDKCQFGESDQCAGTSVATPAIASGLGTIRSRYYTDKQDDFGPKWKEWNQEDECWEGAWRLVARSASPDGRDVVGETSGANDVSLLGDLADHDAWFLDDWTCDSNSQDLTPDCDGCDFHTV